MNIIFVQSVAPVFLGEDRRDNLENYLLGSFGKFFFSLAMFMENSLGLPRHFLKGDAAYIIMTYN